jgi:alanine racemase
MRLTRAEIDLRYLRNNFDGIKKRITENVKIMGIIKANAYGHGLLEIARALMGFGIDYLGVGFLEEGVTLRQNGIDIPILVLGGVLGSQVREFLQYDLEITVSSLEIAERIEHEVPNNNRKKARVHLKIDTGMERIGVHSENAAQFIERVCRMPHLEVVGIYSHLASADEKDKAFTFYQLDRFQSVIKKIRMMGIEIPHIHIANSGAILDLPESYFTMVRPGISLYGIYPSKETSQSVFLQPILTLKSHVVFIKEVAPNTSISYGRKYFTSKKSRIATIPIGYGDGYSRRLSNNSEVLIHGNRFPVVGIICMDQIMVDVGFEANVHVGDDVVLIGKDGDQNIAVWELSNKLGTVPYEVLTGIAARVPRMFIH